MVPYLAGLAGIDSTAKSSRHYVTLQPVSNLTRRDLMTTTNREMQHFQLLKVCVKVGLLRRAFSSDTFPSNGGAPYVYLQAPKL